MDSHNNGNVTQQDHSKSVKEADLKSRHIWEKLPKQANGLVAFADLRKALHQEGFSLSNHEIRELFDPVEHAQAGALSSKEWKNFLAHSSSAVEDYGPSMDAHRRVYTGGHDGDFHISMNQLKHLEYFVAGALASVTSRTVTAPLDRLKVYLIAQTATSKATEALRHGKGFTAVRYSFQSLGQASAALWKAGGTYSLWAGNGLNLFKMIPEGAIKFGTYEATRRFFMQLQGVQDPSQISATAQLVSGGVGGVLAQFTAYPIDTLRFRMQCELVSKGGLRSYYRGLTWGLIGQFPYSALDLATFEYTKRGVTRRKERQGYKGKDAKPGSVATAAIGGFSSAFGASVVWPLNMLRTRLQMQGTTEHPKTYTSILDVTRQTIQSEGFRGLFRGIVPNIVKVVPSGLVTYVVWEKSKQTMGLE